jgi:hypothetical protein
MSITLTGKNRLQLWRLLVSGGSEWPDLMKPPMDSAAERDVMIEAGLLELIKEVPDPVTLSKINAASSSGKKSKAQDAARVTGRKKGPPTKPRPRNRLYLTDKGREYLLNHLGEPVSDRSPSSGPILSWILAALDKNEDGKAAMASILSHSETKVSPDDSPRKVVLTSEILMDELGKLSSSLFMPGGGLRISVLKENLNNYSHQAVDNSLLELEKQGRIVLLNFDDPSRVTAADKELGLRVAGVTRHYLFIK